MRQFRAIPVTMFFGVRRTIGTSRWSTSCSIAYVRVRANAHAGFVPRCKMVAALHVHLTAGAAAAQHALEHASALAWSALVHLSHMWCGLRKHDLMLHFEPGRLSLQ